MRLRVLEDAGRQSVPFTTGILVGIGETPRERVESLLDDPPRRARARARAGGDRPELPGQARHRDARPRRPRRSRTTSRRSPSRALLLGPRMRVQAPPNLTDLDEVGAAAAGRASTTGAASARSRPTTSTPSGPWPHLDELARLTAAAGLHAARAAHRAPRVRARAPTRGSTRASARTSPRSPTPAGSRVEGRVPVGIPWQEPDVGYDAFAARALGRPHRPARDASTPTGRTDDRRSDFDEVYGDWAAIGEHARDIARGSPAGLAERLDARRARGAAPARPTTRRRSRAPSNSRSPWP